MQKVAFICVHNSCRSQIAEALGRYLAADVFESYMEAEGQCSKLLSDLPPVDVVVTMGCNVQCPSLPCKWREDWGLDDPTGQPDQVFTETIRRIEEKVFALKEKLR